MNRLKKGDKQKVNDFKEITGVTRNSIAIDFLQSEGWNAEAAINRYFNAGGIVQERRDPGADAFFEQYKSTDEDMIDAEGVSKLIADLGIAATDKALIAFAYNCGAANMGEFSRAEFLQGCEAAGVGTAAALRARLPHLRAQFDSRPAFREIYLFTFPWACEEGKKIMDLATALALWELLFSGPQAWPFLSPWLAFVEQHHGRPITADTWNLLIDFRNANEATLDKYDESQAWPVLIDDFVEAMRAGKL